MIYIFIFCFFELCGIVQCCNFLLLCSYVRHCLKVNICWCSYEKIICNLKNHAQGYITFYIYQGIRNYCISGKAISEKIWMAKSWIVKKVMLKFNLFELQVSMKFGFDFHAQNCKSGPSDNKTWENTLLTKLVETNKFLAFEHGVWSQVL